MATYTHGHHASVLKSHRWRTAENSAAYLLPHLSPGMAILDVGCGPGTISLDLGQRVGPTGSVRAIDNAPSAIDAARAAASAAGSTNVTFAGEDLSALSADDNTYDIVHAHQVLQHLDHPVAALEEMRRVTKPGGIVAARDADYQAMTWFPDSPVLDRWLELYRAVARRNGGEPDAGRRLLSWARTAGFSDVTASASAWCFATPADREWWGGTWADRATASSFADHALDFGLATPDELAEISNAWRRWAVSDDGWFAILHGEVLCGA